LWRKDRSVLNSGKTKQCITEHPNYKKSKFTKKGDASSRNKNGIESFKIYDNEGYGWYIR
jgi:hypothetical protein